MYWHPLLFSVLSSVIMGLSASSIFLFWFFMELNMLLFLGLLIQSNGMDSGQGIQYFVTQASASSMFLLSWAMLETSTIMSLMMLISMMIKLGAAPFHLWFFAIIKKTNWEIFFLISSLQKMLPLMMIQAISLKLMMFSVLTALVASIGGITATSMKELLGYSSLLSLSWMMSTTMFYFMFFLLCYMIGLSSLISSIQKTGDMNTKSVMGPIFNISKLNFWAGVFSMMGIPPSVGFWGKFLILMSMIKNNLFLGVFLLFLTGVSVYFYLRVILSEFLFYGSMMTPLFNQTCFPFFMFVFTPLGLLF